MKNSLRSPLTSLVYFFGFAIFLLNSDIAGRGQRQAFAMDCERIDKKRPHLEYESQLGPEQLFKELGASFSSSSWAEKRRILVWSGVAPSWMSQRGAQKFCRGRGGRLPTREDFWALSRDLGVSDPEHDHSSDGGLFLDKFKGHLFPRDGASWYWSSSEFSESREFAYTFYSPGGSIGLADLRQKLAVRCVYDLWQKTKRRHSEP